MLAALGHLFGYLVSGLGCFFNKGGLSLSLNLLGH